MLIPKNTKCPRWDECRHARDKECKHRGVDHPVDYNCDWLNFLNKYEPQLRDVFGRLKDK